MHFNSIILVARTRTATNSVRFVSRWCWSRNRFFQNFLLFAEFCRSQSHHFASIPFTDEIRNWLIYNYNCWDYLSPIAANHFMGCQFGRRSVSDRVSAHVSFICNAMSQMRWMNSKQELHDRSKLFSLLHVYRVWFWQNMSKHNLIDSCKQVPHISKSSRDDFFGLWIKTNLKWNQKPFIQSFWIRIQFLHMIRIFP